MPHYADNKNLFPMQGGCSCGHIRYQLDRAPILVHCCHCTTCQRQLGTAFAINAIVESTALSLLASAGPSSAGPGENDPTPIPCAASPVFARLTGAASPPPSVTAPAPAEPVHVTVPSESGIGQTIVQCPVCRVGLWNYYVDAGPHAAYLRVGTLDYPWAVDPDLHIFTRSRRAFVTVGDGKPHFDTYYADRSEFYRPDVLDRVAALEVKQKAYMQHLKTGIASSDNAKTT